MPWRLLTRCAAHCLALWLLAAAAPAAQAQLQRLPPITLGPPQQDGQSLLSPPAVGSGGLADGLLTAPYEPAVTLPQIGGDELDLDVAAHEQRMKPLRDGAFQWAAVGAAWLPRFDDAGLGITDIDFKAILGLPFPVRESPLLLRPTFSVHYLDGPVGTDLPEAVYDIYIESRWIKKWTPIFLTDIGVTPGWYSDLETSDSDALRIGARAIGVYTWSSELKIVGGIVYLDRYDVPFLPAGGVMWDPNPWTSLELIFPVPKLSWRYAVEGRTESWFFVAGEFGGGVWSIERAAGFADETAIRDFRLSLGVERRIGMFTMARAEIGYVFNRRIEYRSNSPEFELDDTLMVRGLLGF